jgi:antitoxin (DNA-binding transcriptional repressor) of toxin-antitoxin stability system
MEFVLGCIAHYCAWEALVGGSWQQMKEERRMYQVKLDDAKSKLLSLINAAIKGEKVLIFKDDQQAVQLVPVAPPERHAQFGSAKGLIVIAEDFDAPLKDFEGYM